MSRIRRRGRIVLLSYSTNVHPSESLPDVREFIRSTTIPLKQRLFPDREMGLELRVGSSLLEAFSDSRAVPAVKDALLSVGLFIFSINGYALGDFQATVVKRSAYEPPWTDPARLEATKRMIRLLGEFLPVDIPGTVSTIAGGWRDPEPAADALDAFARALAEAAYESRRLFDETGREVRLCIEPEPWTWIETTREFAAFYENHLLRAGREHLQAGVGLSPRDAEALLRHFVGMNLDACHHAVVFENAALGVRSIRQAGIPVLKMHLSNAVAVAEPYANRRLLARLQEPRFMHQVFGRAENQAVSRLAPDLPDLLARPESLDRISECRVHLHVPLDLSPPPGLKTTVSETEAALDAFLAGVPEGGFAPVVIETYTWSVLPDPARPVSRPGLIAGLEGEFRWALARLARP
ncbi:MAG: metabolite traffic protein EboE [Planctomycetota bacterium]